MPTLADVAAMLKQQPYAVVSTIRPSGTVQSTLVNVGLYEDGVGLTTVGRSLKERNLKRNPACTVTIHPRTILDHGGRESASAHLGRYRPGNYAALAARDLRCCRWYTTTGRPMTGSCAKNAALQW